MSECIWCFRLPKCQGKMITLPGPEVAGMVFALTPTLSFLSLSVLVNETLTAFLQSTVKNITCLPCEQDPHSLLEGKTDTHEATFLLGQGSWT